MTIAKFLAILLVLAGTIALFGGSKTARTTPAGSMDQKLARIQANGRSPHNPPIQTTFTEQEVNDYLASGEVAMPAGVKSVKLHGEAGAINGTAQVDFDQVRASSRSSNPLLSMFSGVHEVEVATHAYGQGGEGFVHVDSVALDGVEVPRFVLELFVEKYLQPKYPQLGLDSRFKLPDRIDSSTVGEHSLNVVQK